MDQFFLTSSSWMGQGSLLGAIGCFLWGMVSVLFSPCHLVSIPLMVGYVGSYWTIPVGMLLLWVAMDMLGVASCSMSGGRLAKLLFKGLSVAFILGLAYGVLSGSCTFGFIAPILALITFQETLITGLLFIVLFRHRSLHSDYRGRQFHGNDKKTDAKRRLAARRVDISEGSGHDDRHSGLLFHSAAVSGRIMRGRNRIGRFLPDRYMANPKYKSI